MTITADNPWGLPPMPPKSELTARRRRLRRAKATAQVAVMALEEIKARGLRTEPADYGPYWWEEGGAQNAD